MITAKTFSLLEKIMPSATLSESLGISLTSPINAFKCFQIALRSDGGGDSVTDCIISDLTSSVGTITKDNVMVYVEGFVPCPVPSTIEAVSAPAPRLMPDICIPYIDDYVGEKRNALPLILEANKTRAVLIEIYVPLGTAPGNYTGTVQLTGKQPKTIGLSMAVANVTLPSTSSLQSAYPVGYDKLLVGHQISTVSEPMRRRLMDFYTLALLRHRLSNSDVLIPAPVMTGNTTDWSKDDPILNLYFKGNPTGKKLPNAHLTSVRMKDWGYQYWPTARDGYQPDKAVAVQFYKNFAAHYDQLGILDRLFNYVVDEPQMDDNHAQKGLPIDWKWQEVTLTGKLMAQADPRLVRMVTTSIQNATANGVADLIDLFCPTIRYMDNKPTGEAVGSIEPPGGKDTIGNQRSKYGPRVWWYQACGSHGCNFVGGGSQDPGGYHTGWPATMADLPTMHSRILEWLTYKYNVQGQLYFETIAAFDGGAWQDISRFGGNGDGTLFYPGIPSQIGGVTGIPVESMRLKLMRDALQDYELMLMMEQQQGRAAVLGLIDPVAPHVYSFTKDTDAFNLKRNALLTAVSTPPAPAPKGKNITVTVSTTIDGTNYTGNAILTPNGGI